MLDRLEKVIQHERCLAKGDTLFKVDQSFKSLYIVQSGSIKVFLPTSDGDEQIVGFRMPGELLGLDALGLQVHTCTAVALETTHICEIPYDQLNNIANEVPDLREHFMHLMSNEIADEHTMMLMLGKKSAGERIAAFFVSFSERFSKRGFSPNQFNLTMSRHDIANYLGLAVETISRCISHMQEDQIIEADRKYIRILDMSRLRKLAGLEKLPCSQLEEKIE